MATMLQQYKYRSIRISLTILNLASEKLCLELTFNSTAVFQCRPAPDAGTVLRVLCPQYY